MTVTIEYEIKDAEGKVIRDSDISREEALDYHHRGGHIVVEHRIRKCRVTSSVTKTIIYSETW